MKYSIVTISYNEEKRIAETIESILNQTFSNFEYIIIDGKSDDRTVEIANNYCCLFEKRGISYKIFSEKDSGLYNAMNKALNYVTGDYTLFLNAGDSFDCEDVLQSVDECNNENADVIYGRTRYILNQFERVDEAKDYNGLKECMPFCHQSVFAKTCLLKKYGFDEQYRIAADYNLFVQLYTDGVKFERISTVISKFPEGGLSYDDFGKNEFLERTDIRLRHKLISEDEKKKVVDDFVLEYRLKRMKGAIKRIVPNILLKPLLTRRYRRLGWELRQ